MAEYLRGNDGDVWEIDHVSTTCWHPVYSSRTLTELDEDYGPLTPCDADGNDLSAPAVQPADVRTLVAAAFDGLAQQMSEHPPFSFAQSVPDGMRSQMAEWVGEWAKSTADGLRT